MMLKPEASKKESTSTNTCWTTFQKVQLKLRNTIFTHSIGDIYAAKHRLHYLSNLYSYIICKAFFNQSTPRETNPASRTQLLISQLPCISIWSAGLLPGGCIHGKRPFR